MAGQPVPWRISYSAARMPGPALPEVRGPEDTTEVDIDLRHSMRLTRMLSCQDGSYHGAVSQDTPGLSDLARQAEIPGRRASGRPPRLSSHPAPIPEEERARVAALIRKEKLSTDEETQALEDVACLVFLDDQFDDFESKGDCDEDKIVDILRKTWGKMSEPGRKLALGMDLSDRAKHLIGRALAG
uniref:Uncharacterized protein n=1 Tax=Bionectria ochroleuca TaxID=29856 RepID=A0A8H7TSP1_BIOOC